jgi:hypothetical protein
VFQPLIGWATAWSFDRLRLWLEEGIEPGQALRRALVHGVARVGLAAVFLYYALVPKLAGPDAPAVLMPGDLGISEPGVGAAVAALGIAELALAAALVLAWRRRWPIAICATFAIIATAVVAVASPRYLGAAFNPVTLNLGVLCLAAIDLMALSGLPTAGRCRRSPEGVGA